MHADGEQAPATQGQGDPAPRSSYFRRNPWRPWISGAFAGASTVLSVTTLFYALGMLPLALVGISALLAAAAFAFGFYARRRADRFDAETVAGR